MWLIPLYLRGYTFGEIHQHSDKDMTEVELVESDNPLSQ
ncbi:MAG: hypothetical protein ACJAVI_006276, partial [Candidatus Azotimanducaceae bacterium]